MIYKIKKFIKNLVGVLFFILFIFYGTILIYIFFGKILALLFFAFWIISVIGIIKEKIDRNILEYENVKLNLKNKNYKKENIYTEEYLDRFRNKNSDLNLNNNIESEKIKNNTRIKIKEVLSKSELNFYRQLKSYLDGKGFFIFCKVRLVDFLDLSKIKNFSERTSMFNKVSRKHIDFIITDLESNIKFLIELDGEYHYYDKKAIENDKFKNELFKEIGLKLIRFNVKKGFYDLRNLGV